MSCTEESSNAEELPLTVAKYAERQHSGKADVDFFIEEGLNVDEEELEQLLAPPPTKRYMRMHADDEEEEREKKR